MLVLPLVLVLFGSSTAKAGNDCFALLGSGSGLTLMQVCISKDGNLTKFESPAGFDQIGQGNLFRDGYSICTGNLPNFQTVPEGCDAGSEAGFGAPVIVQPNGPNTLPLTITRTTNDGVYQLKQSYALEHREAGHRDHDEDYAEIQCRLRSQRLPARPAGALF